MKEERDAIEFEGVPIITPASGKEGGREGGREGWEGGREENEYLHLNSTSHTPIIFTGKNSTSSSSSSSSNGGATTSLGSSTGGGGGGGGGGEKGRRLTSPLTLRIDRGMHVLVTGPNGSGKSSLFRYAAPSLPPSLLPLFL